MKSQSEKAVVNKMAIILYTILGSILFLAYVLELVKGSKTALQVLALGATDLIPIIVCWILYKKDQATSAIMHVMAVGYGIFYLVTIFVTNERLVFVYAVPMLIIVMMYDDLRYSIVVSSLVSLFAIIHAVKTSIQAGWSTEAIAQTEIEVLLMIVLSAFIIVCSKTLFGLNNEKLEAVDSSAEKTKNVLDKTISISNEMVESIDEITVKMQSLSESCEATLNDMQDVSASTAETADSVQNQLYKTEEIQTQITRVEAAAGDITGYVDDADAAINEGRNNLSNLIDQAKISEEASTSVIKEVEELVKSTEQMQTIVDMINNVASQTSLLALNASIEAARAGEAGRGFAVVSTEISNLANQTQSATGSISEMIETLSSEMGDVTKAINTLIASNESQNKSAAVTAASFEKIVEATEDIRECSKDLSDTVTTLAEANKEIVDSVQTISAITEEVSAHSNTTCGTTEQNMRLVEDTMTIVEELNKNASLLKELQ